MSRRPPRRWEKPPTPTAYAGLTTCLRCDVVFMSWDRRQNRLCEGCRDTMAQEPSEELPYRIPKRRGRRPDGDEG
jgi:hypothetical protein